MTARQDHSRREVSALDIAQQRAPGDAKLAGRLRGGHKIARHRVAPYGALPTSRHLLTQELRIELYDAHRPVCLTCPKLLTPKRPRPEHHLRTGVLSPNPCTEGEDPMSDHRSIPTHAEIARLTSRVRDGRLDDEQREQLAQLLDTIGSAVRVAPTVAARYPGQPERAAAAALAAGTACPARTRCCWRGARCSESGHVRAGIEGQANPG